MAAALCVDCDRTVEIDEHGVCLYCGSKSTLPIQYNKTSNALAPTLDKDKIIENVNEMVNLLRGKKATLYHRAALHLLIARVARMSGQSLGQYLENSVEMWRFAQELLEAEEAEPSQKGN